MFFNLIAKTSSTRKEERNKMDKRLPITALIIGALAIGTVYGAYVSYKVYVEIYGETYPLGIIELDLGKVTPIEGSETYVDYLGEMHVWTYSNDAQLLLQLTEPTQIAANFVSFTVKVCLPLDVVFVIDLASSMLPYMDAVRADMLDLMWVLNTMNECPNRFGIVGFYDYPGETQITPLTDDYTAIESQITGLTAGGEGDFPQSHYLGFNAARDLFETTDPPSQAHDKIIVFISDAESGFNDLPESTHAMNDAWALAEMGVKIHSVLCFDPDLGPDPNAWSQLEYYALISNGNFVPAPLPTCRFLPEITSDPTWMVKLTPITPFDSFRLKPRSSPPTQKEGFYTFHIWVDYYSKAVPWEEFALTQLMANLEKANTPPYLPPPPIGVSLSINPISRPVGGNIVFTWTVTSPSLPEPVPQKVELIPRRPDMTSYILLTRTDFQPHSPTATRGLPKHRQALGS